MHECIKLHMKYIPVQEIHVFQFDQILKGMQGTALNPYLLVCFCIFFCAVQENSTSLTMSNPTALISALPLPIATRQILRPSTNAPPRAHRFCARRPSQVVSSIAQNVSTVRQAVERTQRSVAANVPKDAAIYSFECDAGGNEVSGASEIVAEVASGAYADVVIISHGWNVSKRNGKVPFNHNLARAMMVADPSLATRNVLYVGVCWPSHPNTIVSAVNEEGNEQYEKGVEDALRRIAEKTSVEKTEEKLKGLKINYKKKSKALDVKRAQDPAGYWRDVQRSLEVNDAEAAEGLGKVIDTLESGDYNVNLSTGEIDSSLQAKVEGFAKSLDKTSVDGSELDGEDEIGSIVGGGGDVSKEVELGVEKKFFITAAQIKMIFEKVMLFLSLFGISPPGRVMFAAGAVSNVLERTFFGKFQQRASVVGSRGVHLLLGTMMRAVPEGAKTRFHLVGHSLGCHVATSAAIGCSPGSLLPRKVHSLILLQAAVPCVSYTEGRPYRPLSGVLRPIAGPVIATTSKSDMALYNMEMFNSSVLGRGGWTGLGASVVDVELQNDVNAKLGFEKEKFYTVRADNVINERSGLLYVDLDGAHGDLLDCELQARVWEAIDTPVSEQDLVMPCADDLPLGYWNKDRVIRRSA